MIVMASAASNAGLAVMTACDGFAVALSVTGVLLQLQRGIPRPRRCRGKPQSHPRGLTGQNRPLYSAGFAAPALSLVPGGPCGGTGRRARLKIEFRKECWFDSGQGHQVGCSSTFQSVRNRPRSARKPLKNRHLRVHRCSSPFVLIQSQPSDLLVFLLVSGEQTFTATFALRTKDLSRWPARTVARAPTPSRSGPTSTAAPPDRNSTMARGAPPRFPTCPAAVSISSSRRT